MLNIRVKKLKLPKIKRGVWLWVWAETEGQTAVRTGLGQNKGNLGTSQPAQLKYKKAESSGTLVGFLASASRVRSCKELADSEVKGNRRWLWSQKD